MRILIISHEFPPLGGGIASAVKQLACSLKRQGIKVYILTMWYKGLKKMENIDGVNIYRVFSNRKNIDSSYFFEMLFFLLYSFGIIGKLVKREKIGLVHCHAIVPAGLIGLVIKKIWRIKYVVTAHGTDTPGYDRDRFNLVLKFIYLLWKKIIDNADLITTPSEFLKQLIQKCGVRKSISVIPNIYNCADFTIRSKKKKILLISRLIKRKGFQYFIEAMKDIEHDYEINIVGDGPYRGFLVDLADRYGVDVNFLGWIDNNSEKWLELYQESSIFVYPSERENFPVVLLEAMSARMAIVTTNVAGCKEIVGETALLVRPKNSDDIRDALIKLMNGDELRNRLASKARERVENYSWENVTKKYLQCYLQLSKDFSIDARQN